MTQKEATALIPAGVQFPIRIQKASAFGSIIRNFDINVNRNNSDVTQSLQSEGVPNNEPQADSHTPITPLYVAYLFLFGRFAKYIFSINAVVSCYD